MKRVGDEITAVMNLVTPEVEATCPKDGWVCQICGSKNNNWSVSVDWIFKRIDNPWIPGLCPICEKKKKLREMQQQDAEMQKHKINRIRAIFKRSGIPADYGKFAFSALDIRKGAEKAFDNLKDMSNFERRKPFIILSGLNNTGKSALLGALTNKLAKHEIPCFYINEPVLFGKIKEGFDSTEPIEKELYDAFRQADVILWDEFLFFNYTEKQWIYERAYRLIEEASESEKVMIFATNYDLQDILPRCGKRIWARLSRRKTNFIRMENKPFYDGINTV